MRPEVRLGACDRALPRRRVVGPNRRGGRGFMHAGHVTTAGEPVKLAEVAERTGKSDRSPAPACGCERLWRYSGGRFASALLLNPPMRRLCVLALVAAFPSTAFAQAAIAGSVRAESGAPLGGVVVRAASPALIEQFRVAVTDSAGRYRIEDLRPGSYAVSFTLAGWKA